MNSPGGNNLRASSPEEDKNQFPLVPGKSRLKEVHFAAASRAIPAKDPRAGASSRFLPHFAQRCGSAKDPRFPVAVARYEIRHSEPVFRRARNSRLDFLMLSATPMQRCSAGPNSWTTVVAFDYVDAKFFPWGAPIASHPHFADTGAGSNKD